MTSSGGSALFSGMRVLGLYSNHVPHALRYHRKHREWYVLTSVGKCFHTFNVSRLGIVSVSNSLSEDIVCLAANRMLVFASTGREISAIARNKEVVRRYHGHQQEVRVLLPMGDQLISADAGGDVIVWDVQSGEIYLRLHFDASVFDVSAMLHPSTYLNKALLGSRQGQLQLWNYRTSKLVYTFSGWSSAVTVLQQSPAVDVVGVGTATGRIIIHNIRLDESLMTFTQDWGPITALAFRTDGPSILASCSPQGHVVFWDLARRQMTSQLSHAHRGAVAGATFLHGEPLLVTNGGDNALRVWLMQEEGGARLLRCRHGHAAPPTAIRHHGNDGKNILSAGLDGTLQSFSTVHERFNKNLGHGSINKKKGKKKKHGLKHEELRLPPIIAFCSAPVRQSDWDSVVSVHRGRLPVCTWDYHRCTMGNHHLRPPDHAHGSVATAVDITSCGNFAVIGSSCGRVDVYNLQSGAHRGSFREGLTGGVEAHTGAVRGVATDLLNQLTVSAGSDWLLRFWRFKTKKLEHEIKLPTSPTSARLHRESSMLAVSLEDFSVSVVDMETRRVVRKFSGHRGNVNDMSFSPDGRWLVSASMDCTIRTWDLPSGSLVDCFSVEMAPVGVSLSPTGDFLATAHVDSLGVFLWTNQSLCGPVGLRPLPSDFEPTNQTLPCAGVEEEVTSSEGDGEYVSHDQLGAELVTLSLLPETRWRTLLSLQQIKKRNKPVAPPAAPVTAPFFLPTIPGLTPQFSVPTTTDSQSKLVTWGALGQRSEFSRALEEAESSGSFDAPLALLKDSGPSLVSVEISELSPEGGVAFLRMIDSMLASGRDFDLAHAYLALFLQTHLRGVSGNPVAMEMLLRLSTHLEKMWAELRASFDQSLCLLSYAKSALL